MRGKDYNNELLPMVLRDACTVADHLNQADIAWELNVLLPEVMEWDPPLREVQLRLWGPATDILVAAVAYTFPDPRGVLLLPGPDLTSYPQLGPPKRRDLVLEIALFRFDDGAEWLAGWGDGSKRADRRILDVAAGAVLIPG